MVPVSGHGMTIKGKSRDDRKRGHRVEALALNQAAIHFRGRRWYYSNVIILLDSVSGHGMTYWGDGPVS